MFKLTPNMVHALKGARYIKSDTDRKILLEESGEEKFTGWAVFGMDGRTRAAMHKRGYMHGHYYLTPEGVEIMRTVRDDVPAQEEKVENDPAPVSLGWHVYANGAWSIVEYDGYAPVNVMIDGQYFPVKYRHIAAECNTVECTLNPNEKEDRMVTAPLATSVVKVGALIGVVTGDVAENGTLFEFTVSGGEYPRMWTAVVGPWTYISRAEIPAPVVERPKFALVDYRDNMGEEHIHCPGCADIKRAVNRGDVEHTSVYSGEFESVTDFGIHTWGDIASDNHEDGSPEWLEYVMELTDGMRWHACTRGIAIPRT